MHLDDGLLRSWLDKELSPESTEAVAAHLAECSICVDPCRGNQNDLLSHPKPIEFTCPRSSSHLFSARGTRKTFHTVERSLLL